MKRAFLIVSFLILSLARPASAATQLSSQVSLSASSGPGAPQAAIAPNNSNSPSPRYIVHTTGGLAVLQSFCLPSLCRVLEPLDGGLNHVLLILGPANEDPSVFLALLASLPGVLNAELDQTVTIASGSATATAPPPSLVNTTPVQYYGSVAWEGYVNQPATQIIQLAQAQGQFNLSGSGIIADIDTGVDPNHPVLQPVLLPGYDFTRNQVGGSEMNDLPGGAPSNESPCSSCTPGQVNQYSMAMVDSQSVAMVAGQQYGDFGHGTMVAGVLHLVAPTAWIMPLKTFGANGTGNLSDIIRAIYYASANNASVVNMSFDLTTYSQELATSINYAEQSGLIFVASSGNDGQMEMVYPAGLTNVMGVASTNYQDQRSVFSNYGDQIVWIAAPGEAIVTTYPFGTYAAGWGTSFSAPLVSATADLVAQAQPGIGQQQAQIDLAQAQFLLAAGMGNGRLEVTSAIAAACLQ
jgi:subtilisin family serine protease